VSPPFCQVPRRHINTIGIQHLQKRLGHMGLGRVCDFTLASTKWLSGLIIILRSTNANDAEERADMRDFDTLMLQ
jgi:hypothetical protein